MPTKVGGIVSRTVTIWEAEVELEHVSVAVQVKVTRIGQVPFVVTVRTVGKFLPTVLTVTTNGTCPILVTFTWTATDTCSNSTSASQIVTVRDTIPPTLVGIPANGNFQCLSDVNTGLVTATDNCDTNVQ